MDWDPSTWRKSRKLLLGVATIWPPIYMAAFVMTVFGVTSYFTLQGLEFNRRSQNIDLFQLQQKIRDDELSQMTVKPTEVVACDRSCDCEYHTAVTNRETRAEIVRQARELNQNGAPHVPLVKEENSQPKLFIGLGIGLIALFGVHMISIMLMFLLLALYLVLIINQKQFDQSTQIIWIILICLLGNLAMPVYWFLYVWNATPPNSSEPITT